MKYVDDITAAQAFKMKTDLEVDPNRNWPKPAMNRERFEKQGPRITLSAEQLCRGEPNETQQDKGDAAKQNDFMPEIAVEGQNLEVAEEFKLIVMRGNHYQRPEMGSKH